MQRRSSPPRARRSLLSSLKALAPRDFEHLTYDLLVLSGLRNAVWRTPGADAGRDIEGDYVAIDLSESSALQHWYVECKRYSRTLDWPAVFGKIAYASNHGADFLLVVTTGLLSPQCRSELSTRDMRRERPSVRVWDGPSLENLVSRQPLLLAKYALGATTDRDGLRLGPLVTIASKAVQSAYASTTSELREPALEFAAATMELLSSWSKWEAPQRLKRFVYGRDSYPWCHVAAGIDLSTYDAYGLRALLAALRFYAGLRRVKVRQEQNQVFVDLSGITVSQVLEGAIRSIGLWTNIEPRFYDSRLWLMLRV